MLELWISVDSRTQACEWSERDVLLEKYTHDERAESNGHCESPEEVDES